MLILFKIFMYFLLPFRRISASGVDYCGVAFCNNSKAHVMCQFQLEGPARHCINYERTIKSALDQQVVLDKINSRRNKVASGEIRSLGAADNMMKMDWNEELASSAQRWADQCVSNNSPDLKDTCRDLSYSQVGQNIATVYDDAPGLTPAMLVDLWYIELLNVNSSTSVPLFNYQRSPAAGSEHYDYFTQLIWAETTHVGCGAVKFKEEIDDVEGKRKRTVYRLVCNFAPAGNQIHKAVYSVGSPCTRCPFVTCDSVFTALCTQNERHTSNEKYENISTETKTQKGQQTKYYTVTESLKQNLNNISKNITDILSEPKINNDNDENISFDFITDPPKHTVQSSIHGAENTTVCKDVLAVDDLFDLLKRKLSSDGSFRELLLTRQSPPSTEETFTDPSVAAIMNKIYSTKLLPTTTHKTDNEFLNSTLLVDLVEAVIFRNSDKMVTFEVTELNTPSTPDVNPVKIQAELGEVRSNSDFAGHYFFPEDENDHPSSDKLENYYDSTDFPISDVAFEIEELRRNKGTKDFLEDILESDFVTETETQVHINDDLTITQS